ncbi:Uma2 family endonuclease [Murinocardiopsis flavida]|nr:Uma2 family endonuclease [Murinocardiopsis flavida]
MTAHETWELLLRAWQEIDVPQGWRAEIHGEEIVVVPPPSGSHGLIASDIQWELRKLAPEGGTAVQNLGVQIPAVGRLYIPDLVFAMRKDIPLDSTPIAAADLLLVVEITSRGNVEEDRDAKRRAYASGEVPLYLLIDSWDKAGPTVTLFSDPGSGDYASARREPFGTPVQLPKPFEVDLETFEFPVHPGVAKRR